MRRKYWMGVIVFVMIGAALLPAARQKAAEKPMELTYPAFWEMAESGQVESVIMGDGESWQAELTDGTRARTPNPRAHDGKERLLALGIQVREQGQEMPALAAALLAGGLLLLLLRARGTGTMGMRQLAAVKPDSHVPDITFSDVAAPGETLRAMEDLAAFLKEPERFARCGARFPRGVLLYGPPGTGKTLLARALAGEAKAPFFAMSGADFVQVYVGVGASRVRDVFKKARKAGGGVIFIDEIDAIGKKRDSGNDEREQTLNALLTEMSGFSGQDGVMVLAATNRLDTLDPALLREGRFDRRIEVGLPDYAERLKILAVHARGKPLEKDVDLEKLARQTTLFSGAQLETLLNEAAIRAARQGKTAIGSEEVERAFCLVTVGEERPRQMTDMEKRITAWHEAGHALITHCLLPDAVLTRVTILPSSRGAAGYSMSVQPDKLMYTKRELKAMICAALAGRAAEEMLLGKDNVTTGAENDWQHAREIARRMAGEWAMGESGNPDTDERDILQQAMAETRCCLAAHAGRLRQLAEALLARETLGEEEIVAILK